MLRVLASVQAQDVMAVVRKQLADTQAAAAAADAKAQAADSRALAADDRAANAQQMVRNDRPKLATLEQQQASLEQLAATLGAAVPASEKVHADLWAAINAQSAKALAAQVKRFPVTVAVGINATGTVSVTWDQPWSDTTYTPLLLAPVNVTDVTVTSKTATTTTFTYKTGLLSVTVGQVFHVVGLRFG